MDDIENRTGKGRVDKVAPELSPVHFSPFEPEAEVHRGRRNLPHWQQAGVAYFVTFRLGDSVPVPKLHQWVAERKAWKAKYPEPWSDLQWKDYNRLFPARMEKWLDAGEGHCALAKDDVSRIVEGALLHFDGQRYVMDAYAIMPNHVHVLVSPKPSHDLSQVLHGWKSYTAHEINKLIRRTGSFWQDENFDHIVRSVEQLELFRKYIRENPVKGRVPVGKFKVGTGIGLLLDEEADE